jgi:hypothetical protein
VQGRRLRPAPFIVVAQETVLCDTTTMAFVRKRTTKTGAISTALVESYRKDGKPRHRVLANLHGAESLTDALGRLAAERDKLRKEREQLEPDIKGAAQFYDTFTGATINGHAWTQEERKEIDRLLRMRRRVLKRANEIDARLAVIQHEGVAIKKHSTASADEIRVEAEKHAKRLHDAELEELGRKLMMAGDRNKFIRRYLKR